MTEMINDVQANVCRFNQEEAIWHCFATKRARRKRLLPLLRLLNSTPELSEKKMDQLDWLAAEREMRRADCVGIQAP
jgi:hypothetical protein